jgi:hypothetical protein
MKLLIINLTEDSVCSMTYRVERLCCDVLHLWCRIHLLCYLIPYAADNRSLSASVSVELVQDFALLNVLHMTLGEVFGFQIWEI